MNRIFRYLAVAALVLAPATAARAADDVASFYQGKQITMLVGSDVGGGYDTYARLVAHHLGGHIPGRPTFVVQNMAGSGSLKMTNYVANVAPKDGTVIGAPQNGIAFEPVFHLLSPGGKKAKYDGTRLNWIGSAEQGVYVSVFWHTAGVKSLDDLRKKQVLVGASSLNTDEAVLANMLNHVFGTKLKLITGYKGNAAIMHAMEQGEVSGVTATSYASLAVKQPTWLKEGKVTIPIQMALDPGARPHQERGPVRPRHRQEPGRAPRARGGVHQVQDVAALFPRRGRAGRPRRRGARRVPRHLCRPQVPGGSQETARPAQGRAGRSGPEDGRADLCDSGAPSQAGSRYYRRQIGVGALPRRRQHQDAGQTPPA